MQKRVEKVRPANLPVRVNPLALMLAGLWDGSRWSVLGACGRGFNPLQLHQSMWPYGSREPSVGPILQPKPKDRVGHLLLFWLIGWRKARAKMICSTCGEVCKKFGKDRVGINAIGGVPVERYSRKPITGMSLGCISPSNRRLLFCS